MTQDENLTRFIAGLNLSHKSIIARNFIGGIAWGVGSVIGATLIIAIAIGFLRTINFIPIIGTFATQVVSEVQNQRKIDR